MQRVKISGAAFAASGLLAAVALISCDTADYRQPIAQFQDASAVVTEASRDVLIHFNTIGRDAAIDRAVSRKTQIDIEAIRSRQIITQDEIDIRIGALDAFQSYMAALAELARGRGEENISAQTGSLSAALSSFSQRAAALPKSNANFVKNGDLGTSLTSLANAAGAIASLIAEHKAKKEIAESVMRTKKPVEDFTNLLESELVECLAVEKTAVADEEVFYAKSYQDELRKSPPDAANLLVFGEHIKSYIRQRDAMDAANPRPSFEAMRKAHAALIQFAGESHNPRNVSELFASAQTFFAEVKPFGAAVQALANLK
ncbi:MAG: hypothetical protein KGN84_07040 [Acidobacteriota bacterium]|nr:hypothetical protein [Acidobacteriota bacterium]